MSNFVAASSISGYQRYGSVQRVVKLSTGRLIAVGIDPANTVNGALYSSDDNGQTWTIINNTFISIAPLQAAIGRDLNDNIYVVTSGSGFNGIDLFVFNPVTGAVRTSTKVNSVDRCRGLALRLLYAPNDPQKVLIFIGTQSFDTFDSRFRHYVYEYQLGTVLSHRVSSFIGLSAWNTYGTEDIVFSTDTFNTDTLVAQSVAAPIEVNFLHTDASSAVIFQRRITVLANASFTAWSNHSTNTPSSPYRSTVSFKGIENQIWCAYANGHSSVELYSQPSGSNVFNFRSSIPYAPPPGQSVGIADSYFLGKVTGVNLLVIVRFSSSVNPTSFVFYDPVSLTWSPWEYYSPSLLPTRYYTTVQQNDSTISVFYSSGASTYYGELDIAFNEPPNVPTNVQRTGLGTDNTPNFSASISDPDTDQQIKARFRITRASDSVVIGTVDSAFRAGAGTVTAEYATALASGNYTVEAKAIDDLGEESAYSAPVAFAITQPVTPIDIVLRWNARGVALTNLDLLWSVTLGNQRDFVLRWDVKERRIKDLDLAWRQRHSWSKVGEDGTEWRRVYQ